ncbi:hypothetical protein Swit_4071 [Rhizorhabdus wittichii RW1]|uniref:Uncharacterized protein n=1 Tax=Rhizorhabdus wittichii (strain DSM 6014 / CCUG 31198 / JCM 15750 / NBRC 105917 / EY 4224 / RW1) TaxID=392499 RepID=A0A9J9LFG1_RHIWR|nr:hypothetical protein Swit_4071 [Rhizorhabdus wittichii RW1]
MGGATKLEERWPRGEPSRKARNKHSVPEIGVWSAFSGGVFHPAAARRFQDQQAAPGAVADEFAVVAAGVAGVGQMAGQPTGKIEVQRAILRLGRDAMSSGRPRTGGVRRHR